jgi:hypothetical protein
MACAALTPQPSRWIRCSNSRINNSRANYAVNYPSILEHLHSPIRLFIPRLFDTGDSSHS